MHYSTEIRILRRVLASIVILFGLGTIFMMSSPVIEWCCRDLPAVTQRWLVHCVTSFLFGVTSFFATIVAPPRERWPPMTITVIIGVLVFLGLMFAVVERGEFRASENGALFLGSAILTWIAHIAGCLLVRFVDTFDAKIK